MLLLVLFFSTKLLAQEQKTSIVPSGNSKAITAPLQIAAVDQKEEVELLRPERPVIYGSFEFGPTPAGATVEKSIEFKGVRPGHTISVFVPHGARVPGAVFSVHIYENDKVTLRYTNTSSELQDPGGIQTFKISVQ